jgi:general secretion pathway protein E
MNKLIGELLVERGALRPQDVARALQEQAHGAGDRIGAILVRMGIVSEPTLLAALSQQLATPVLDLRNHPRLPEQVRGFMQQRGLREPLLRRMGFVAWSEAGSLHLAARDTQDSQLLELIEGLRGESESLQAWLVSSRDLDWLLAQAARLAQAEGASTRARDLRQLAEDAPVVELVNNLLARANDASTSDIHVEPTDTGFVVRYRVDGVLRAADQYPRDRFDAVVSRIKLIAGLDIAERRLPQDGRFSARAAGVETDIRVSVIPSVRGESIVLRLLPQSGERRIDLHALGFEPDHLELFQQWMQQPDGIILVTGPTGSGKSTTLYAALEASDRERERILTVEDPVEYQVPGITQFQVHPDIGFTFPAALRAILRHDPDTIMIGEIRDAETARIAVQASLTGHKVLSTLHTNDSATAFLRLADMGVETFLVGATVRGVIAQRLVRRLCTHCAQPLSADMPLPEQARALYRRMDIDRAALRLLRAAGCERCSHTGYKGRVAVYELLAATPEVKAALAEESRSHVALLRRAGSAFRNLREDALLKAARGVTSIEEAMSVGADPVEASPAA